MIRAVALLTDFGAADPYVAEMKAALLAEWARFPEPEPLPVIVDVSHAVPPGDVAAGAWLLARVQPRFPAGTVFLAVVDPGVGTGRPALAVEARGQTFVGPGNGLLAFLTGDAPAPAAVRLDNPLYQRGGPSGPAPTFHGRDVFAPAAAHLALGVPLAQVGSAVPAGQLAAVLGPPPGARAFTALFPAGAPAAPAVPPAPGAPGAPAPPGRAAGGGDWGRLVWVDNFGNAISDIARDSPRGAALAPGATVRIGGVAVPGPLPTYAAAAPGAPFWYWGSGGTLEAAVRDAPAASRLGWRPGMAVERDAP